MLLPTVDIAHPSWITTKQSATPAAAGQICHRTCSQVHPVVAAAATISSSESTGAGPRSTYGPGAMSATTDSSQGGGSPGGGMFDVPKIGGFGYGIGVSVGILVLITTITLASYFCTRNNQPAPPRQGGGGNSIVDEVALADVEAGIDEATLMSYPKLLYAQVKTAEAPKEEEEAVNVSCCSICLADYKDADLLRRLPDCKHLFHLKCVDPWLRLHPTCPVCRTSPLPSPLPTPLAELVPLARRQP